MPKLDGILETAIHTEDMARSRAFYEGVPGLAKTGSKPKVKEATEYPLWVKSGHVQCN